MSSIVLNVANHDWSITNNGRGTIFRVDDISSDDIIDIIRGLSIDEYISVIQKLTKKEGGEE